MWGKSASTLKPNQLDAETLCEITVGKHLQNDYIKQHEIL